MNPKRNYWDLVTRYPQIEQAFHVHKFSAFKKAIECAYSTGRLDEAERQRDRLQKIIDDVQAKKLAEANHGS